MTITADRLIEGVKRKVTIPASQVRLTTSDMLDMADDIISGDLVPLLISLRQEYFVTDSTTALVSAQEAYDIPYRAIGRTLRDMKLQDSSGAEKDMTLVALEDEHLFITGGDPHSFYFKGDKVVIIPPPGTTTNVLHMFWEMPPNRLVLTSEAAQVVSKTTTVVTVSSIPSVITTGTVVDFIQNKQGSSTLDFDVTVQNASGTSLTFTSGDIPTTLAVGDWISVAQTSPVIQLPDEMYSLLETKLARDICYSISDFEGYKMMEAKEKKDEMNIKMLLEPRIQGESTKIINRRGLLRGRRGLYRWGVPS